MTCGTDHHRACSDYLGARTGTYEYRRRRYRAVADAVQGRGPLGEGEHLWLDNADTLVDLGAGWTELDVVLRCEEGWRGRYVPIDGAIDGADLDDPETFKRVPDADHYVALELLEHLAFPGQLVLELQRRRPRSIAVTTPNPAVVDVLAIDPTHRTPVSRGMLEAWGFNTREVRLFDQDRDSILGLWT